MIRQRLEAYRRQEQKEKLKVSLKNTVRNLLPWSNKMETEPLKEVAPTDPEEDKDAESTCSEEEEPQKTVLLKVTYLLYFLLWATMYVIAIEYEFGAVYFIVTALIFICLNTRSKPKKKGEPSAYSVFNPNCEAIEGTLDASQFEKEIRYGMGVMR